MSILNKKNDILEIQIEKENNIVKLEKDILNLTEIFNDLDIIVSNQSEFLDSIENNIIISNENIEQSSEILEKANINNKKKKKYILKFIGGFIVLIPIAISPIFAPIIGIKILAGTLISTTGIGSSLLIISNKKLNSS